MAVKFKKLHRRSIRRLPVGETLTEHGISAQRLDNDDVRYSVNIMVDGKRIHRVIGCESEGVTRTQAEEFISNARAESRASRLNLPHGRKLHLTLGEAADIYLKRLKETGGKDYRKNEQHIRLHLKPFFGTMRFEEISTFTLRKFQKRCQDKGLSHATINRVLATYRRMGRRLAEWKVIPAPPAMIRLEAERNQRDYVISDAEETALLEAASADSNPYIWLFIKVGLATGLRHGEILGMRFENFDSAGRRIRVNVKGGKFRNQPLTKGISVILEQQRKASHDSDGWVFPSRRAPSGHITSMDAAFARCVKEAGMDSSVVTPHVMRHTAITRLAETGADIKTIQEFSGHDSIAMVLRYAHAQSRAVDRALDAMEKRTIREHPASEMRRIP